MFAPSALVALAGGASHLNQPQRSADLSWLGGGVLVCPVRLEGAALSLRPCLGVELGAVHASGNTAIDPRSAVEPMASLDGILRLRWLVTTRFFVEAQAAASLELLRTRYFFEPDQTIYVVPPVTGRGAIGLGVHLQ